MIIDSFYSDIDKNNFYLGVVSQVYKNSCVTQVENLTWLNTRRINNEILTPNTINYFVVIDSIQGFFIGEVFQSKMPNSESVHNALTSFKNEKIYPELSIDIFGLMKNGDDTFKPIGFNAVGLTDTVYIANSAITSKYLKSIENPRLEENYLKKKLSSFARVANLGFLDLNLSPETLFDRHLIAVGSTNSGKSTTSLSILDKLILDEKKILVIDPSGEYAESFVKDKVKTLVLGSDTVLDTGEVSFSQWATLFETNDATQPAVLSDAIKSLRFQKKNGHTSPYVKKGRDMDEVSKEMTSLTPSDTSFDISLLPSQISEEAVEADKNMKKYQGGAFQFNNKQWLVQKVEYKLNNALLKDFFGGNDQKFDLLQEISSFMNGKTQSLYINASEIGVGEGIGAMLIDLISNYIINRKKKDKIAFVMFIDEVHRYSKDPRSGGFQTGLTAIAREGRKKGIFLFLTTQNPQDVSNELLGQIGSMLVHRLTHKNELEAVRNFFTDNSFKQIPKLNQGEAIFTSINLLTDLHLIIDKCPRNHNNSTITL
ncbi:ATP-binding protein [Proteiniclasticum sp. QWL-01]|uniref:ATP-binding protein n=1 Tax=Proteiniclasticum sp. QWL-01 TaxID=3036945 RepID=UPI002411346E|nr:ATP-binding protein [Proteiniclasticum sp. QWL-01]WFF73605.1 ATP-binding protein [Proteiniclasticum sp. QWL-01]